MRSHIRTPNPLDDDYFQQKEKRMGSISVLLSTKEKHRVLSYSKKFRIASIELIYFFVPLYDTINGEN